MLERRGTSLHGLSKELDHWHKGEAWRVDYTFPGSVDVLRDSMRREPGLPERVLEVGTQIKAGDVWTWGPKVNPATQRWLSAVVEAERREQHVTYVHEGEVVFVWDSVPSRHHEVELLEAGFVPTAATWRAPHSSAAERLARRLARELVRWHRTSLSRVEAPPELPPADEDELIDRADQLWLRWWSRFRHEVGDHPLRGRPVLDLSRGVLTILFGRGNVLAEAELDVRRHPLIYPASFTRGNTTLMLPGLAWEDFDLIPQVVADLARPSAMGSRYSALPTSTWTPPPSPARALTAERQAQVTEIMRSAAFLDFLSTDAIDTYLARYTNADAARRLARRADLRLITEAILLHARGLDVRLLLDPWSVLVVVDETGQLAAVREVSDPVPALAAELGPADQAELQAIFRDASHQAAVLEHENAAGVPYPQALDLIPPGLQRPPQREPVKQVEEPWADLVARTFNRTPGPELHLDRNIGGRLVRFILLREGGRRERAEDLLAVVLLDRDADESRGDEDEEDGAEVDAIVSIEWSPQAHNLIGRAAIAGRIKAALAVAHGRSFEEGLQIVVRDLARRVEEIGEREPSAELADLLADLREPGREIADFVEWLRARQWKYAADALDEWKGVGARPFLAELWDMIRDALSLVTVESDGRALFVEEQALEGEGAERRVLRVRDDPPGAEEILVRVLHCDDENETCEIEAAGLERGDRLYNLRAYPRTQLAELHKHMDTVRATLERAPSMLRDLRRALVLTARLIDHPRCQGEPRSEAIRLLHRAWRLHNAARTLVLEGRPEQSLEVAELAAEMAARASAESGIACASGLQTLPFDGSASTAPAAPPIPEDAAPATPAEPTTQAEHDTLTQVTALLEARVGEAEDRSASEPPQLREIHRALDLAAAVLEEGSPRDALAAMWATPPPPSAERLVVDRDALRRALGGERRLAALDAPAPKATGTIKANVGRIWQFFTTSVYESGDLPVIATREALQNSVDAIRAALRQGKLGAKQGRFSVTWDPERRALSWEDNGVGMDADTLADKFLSIGDTGKGQGSGAVGGFGVAKAVILGTSTTFRWEVHSRNNRVVSRGVDEKWEMFEAEHLAGTRITVFDVSPEFDWRLHPAHVSPQDLLTRLRVLLAANDLPEIALTLAGEKLRPMFSPRGGQDIPVQGSWGPGTSARVRAYRRPPGDKRGAYYIRLGGLFQYATTGWRGVKADIVIDLTTTELPGSADYPLTAARDRLQARPSRAFQDLRDEVEREDESVANDRDFDIYEADADTPDERSGAAELAQLAEEALEGSEFQEVLSAASGGLRDFYAEQLANPGVSLPTESLAPAGARSGEVAETRGLPPGLAPTALIPVAPDVADPDPKRHAVQQLRAVLESVESEDPLRVAASDVLTRAERDERLEDRDVQIFEQVIDRATEAAIGPGGGGLLQIAAITHAADAALARLAPNQKKKPERRNPFGRMAGLMISRKGYDRRRAGQFRRHYARWLPHLTLWDATLRLIAGESGIRRKFKPGFVLEDRVYGRSSKDTVFINPDKLAQVLKAHRERPLGIAAFLHGIACHELTHLDGRLDEGHSESYMVAREDLGVATGHLLPVIALLAQRILKLPSKPSAEQRRIGELERQLERARRGGRSPKQSGVEVARLQRQLAEARAAQAAALAESARVRAECDDIRTAQREAPAEDLRERATLGLAKARAYYAAVRMRLLAGTAVAPPRMLAALKALAVDVARLALRSAGHEPAYLDLSPLERASLDHELERSVA